jgi:hypothetical protein
MPDRNPTAWNHAKNLSRREFMDMFSEFIFLGNEAFVLEGCQISWHFYPDKLQCNHTIAHPSFCFIHQLLSASAHSDQFSSRTLSDHEKLLSKPLISTVERKQVWSFPHSLHCAIVHVFLAGLQFTLCFQDRPTHKWEKCFSENIQNYRRWFIKAITKFTLSKK